MTNPQDHDFLFRDLREQLNSAIDTVIRLRDQGDLVRNRLSFLVDQGEGLTPDQLFEVYKMVVLMFPKRVRRDSDLPLDHGL